MSLSWVLLVCQKVKLSGWERSNYLCSHSVLCICLLGERLSQFRSCGVRLKLVHTKETGCRAVNLTLGAGEGFFSPAECSRVCTCSTRWECKTSGSGAEGQECQRCRQGGLRTTLAEHYMMRQSSWNLFVLGCVCFVLHL